MTQKKKTCRPIPSISLSMHPMMRELVRSLRGLIHHCRMQDKKMCRIISFLNLSAPTLSPPQSNPRARLQKYCRLQAFPSITLPVNIVVVVLFPIKILVVAITQLQKSLSPREWGRSKWITPRHWGSGNVRSNPKSQEHPKLVKPNTTPILDASRLTLGLC